jgi:hypothetical protein
LVRNGLLGSAPDRYGQVDMPGAIHEGSSSAHKYAHKIPFLG